MSAALNRFKKDGWLPMPADNMRPADLRADQRIELLMLDGSISPVIGTVGSFPWKASGNYAGYRPARGGEA